MKVEDGNQSLNIVDIHRKFLLKLTNVRIDRSFCFEISYYLRCKCNTYAYLYT